jgi:hypothetical protein
MEVSQVRKRVQQGVAAARTRAQERRQQTDEATRDYKVFLEVVATPLVQQLANVLKVEGYAFTASTPGDGVRLTNDRGRDDFVELALDTSGERPQVVGRITQSRGSRRLDEERPIKAGASPSELTDEDVLEFLMSALQPWLV